MTQIIDTSFKAFNSQKATILMAAYNAEKYILETLDSVFKQTYQDFNLLVVEDGSSDSTLALLKSYNHPNLYIHVNPKNIRLVASLNKGLDLIDTTYILRMDADDLISPHRLERQITYMDDNPNIDLSGTYIKYFGDRDDVIKLPLEDAEIKANLPFHSIMPHATVIFRTAHLNTHKYRYSEKHIYMEDADLWARMSDHSTFAILPEVLYDYRWEGQNITAQNMASRQQREHAFFAHLYARLNINMPDDLLGSWLKKRNDKILNAKAVKDGLRFLNVLIFWHKEIGKLDKVSFKMKIKSERKHLFFVACDNGFKAASPFFRYPSIIAQNWKYFLSKAILKR